MSLTRQTVVFEPSFMGAGYLPLRIPSHQELTDIGINGVCEALGVRTI